MVELRSYQRDLLGRIEEALAASKSRMMLQLPTGGGKTHIAGELLSRWLKDGRKAIWLTHRRELATQEELKELAMLRDDDELSPHRDPFLKNFLEEERCRIGGPAEERKEELRFYIGERESELTDEKVLDRAFENYLAKLPAAERPQTRSQDRRLFSEWMECFEKELALWREELAGLESQSIDGQLVLDNAKDQLLRLLEAEATEVGLLPQREIRETLLQGPFEEYSRAISLDSGRWMTFVRLGEWGNEEPTKGASITPWHLQCPRGEGISISYWIDLFLQTAEWLIREGLLTENRRVLRRGGSASRYLIHVKPYHTNGRKFKNIKQLSNGLYVDGQLAAKEIGRPLPKLVEDFGQDPSQFHVRLRE